MIRTLSLSLAIIAAMVIGILQLDPIPQDVAYHSFADQRSFHGIPHFYNVASNALFILFGCIGLLLSRHRVSDGAVLRRGYGLFFCAAILLGLASGMYHVEPDNHWLFWDRLIMTVLFMVYSCLLLTESDLRAIGKVLLIPAMFVGTITAIYWDRSELGGDGDLRFYLMVQLTPILLTPVILLSDNTSIRRDGIFWSIFILFIFAKLCEHFDVMIFHYLREISGHTLKHILGSIAVLLMVMNYRSLIQRRLADDG